MVEGLVRLMSSEHVGPVNLGHPGETTILEFAEKVKALTGSRSQIVFEPSREDDPVQRDPDISLAREVLRWDPKVSLDAGLRRTIEYFDHALKGFRPA
jgi:nucleoside-diphosphate-sugar epimerase